MKEEEEVAMRTESRTVTQIRSETVVKPGSLKLRFKWVKVIKCQHACINVVVNELYDLIILILIGDNQYFGQTVHD